MPFEYEARPRGNVDLDLVPVVFTIVESDALVHFIALNQIVSAETGIISVENQSVGSGRNVDAIVRVGI